MYLYPNIWVKLLVIVVDSILLLPRNICLPVILAGLITLKKIFILAGLMLSFFGAQQLVKI